MKIQLPEHVKQIIHRLQQEGYDAYAVGGCVRDTLLGRSPQDWDITTSAKPHCLLSDLCHDRLAVRPAGVLHRQIDVRWKTRTGIALARVVISIGKRNTPLPDFFMAAGR